MWPILLGALYGAVQNRQAQQNEQADREEAANTQRYSNWTGLRANPVRRANNPFLDIGAGALKGYQFGQSIEGNADENALLKEALGELKGRQQVEQTTDSSGLAADSGNPYAALRGYGPYDPYANVFASRRSY